MISHEARSPAVARNEFAKRRSLLLGGAALSVLAPLTSKATPVPGPVVSTVGTTGAYFNILDYGASPLGSSDATSAIQAAISAAQAAGGGIVLVPAGLFLVSGSISVSGTPVTIQGVGAATSILLVPSASSANTLSVSGVDAFTLREIGFTSTTNRTAGRAIYLSNTTNCLIDHVNMHGQFVGCEISGGNTHRIHNSIWYMAPNGTGFRLAGSNSNDTYLDNLYIVDGYCGFNIQNTGCIIMQACETILATYGLLINPGNGQVVHWSFFEACAFDSTDSHCIYLTTTGTGAILGLTFTNCWSATTTSGDCCAVTGNTDGVDFVAHRFLNASIGNGLLVFGPAKNIHADACVAAACPQGNGFAADQNAQRFAFRNCYSGPYGALAGNAIGMQVTAGCSSYIISNNFLAGNTTSSLVDSGSAPKVSTANLNLADRTTCPSKRRPIPWPHRASTSCSATRPRLISGRSTAP